VRRLSGAQRLDREQKDPRRETGGVFRLGWLRGSDACDASTILVNCSEGAHTGASPVTGMRTTIRSAIRVLTCGVLLVGCAHTGSVSNSLKLKDGEGVIVYQMTCGSHIAWGQFLRSGQGSAGFLAGFDQAGSLLCREEGVQTKRLEAGRYYIGRIGYTGAAYIRENEAMTFTVTPGKLNYIGHIWLRADSEHDRGRVVVSVRDPVALDKSVEAKDWLSTEQGPLLQRYEFINALAQAPMKVAR
jgi:hypothetical protein